MTPDNDTPDDALTRDYRRGSATEAGRPAAATRAAILAEARALAQRRARKDPRVPWAIAASVSVIGIAVLLWRQVGLQTMAPVQVAPSAQVTPAPADVAPSADVAAPVETPPLTAPRVAASPSPPPPVVALPASPPAPSALAKAQPEPVRERAADAVMPARLEAAARAVAPAAAGAVANASSAAPRSTDTEAPASVLRKRFPEEYTSPSPPHTLWVLRNARGEVLRTGSLNDSASLETVSVEVQRAYPARRLIPWIITPLTNERGIPVELAIATLAD